MTSSTTAARSGGTTLTAGRRPAGDLLTRTLDHISELGAPILTIEDALDRVLRVAAARVRLLGDSEDEAIQQTLAVCVRVNPLLLRLAIQAAQARQSGQVTGNG